MQSVRYICKLDYFIKNIKKSAKEFKISFLDENFIFVISVLVFIAADL